MAFFGRRGPFFPSLSGSQTDRAVSGGTLPNVPHVPISQGARSQSPHKNKNIDLPRRAKNTPGICKGRARSGGLGGPNLKVPYLQKPQARRLAPSPKQGPSAAKGGQRGLKKQRVRFYTTRPRKFVEGYSIRVPQLAHASAGPSRVDVCKVQATAPSFRRAMGGIRAHVDPADACEC